MKINKYIIGLGLTFSFLFAGCDSLLDPAKDGKLGEEDIWNYTTPDGKNIDKGIA